MQKISCMRLPKQSEVTNHLDTGKCHYQLIETYMKAKGALCASEQVSVKGKARLHTGSSLQDYNDDNELHSLRQLVRDLQDEVDSEVGLLPDMKIPSLAKIPSTSRYLAKPTLKSRQNILSVAAWALSNAVADNLANQDFARFGQLLSPCPPSFFHFCDICKDGEASRINWKSAASHWLLAKFHSQ